MIRAPLHAADGVMAVDLGKTGCRVKIWRDGGHWMASGSGAPGLAARDGVDSAMAAILAVTALLPVMPDLTVVVGAAGALSAPEAARELAKLALVRLSAGTAVVTSDAVTSHAGALAGRPGTVLAVGTGAVALAIGAEGQFARVDGHGPWLGDEGSGAWLGLAGLRAVLRAADGRGPATSMTDAARIRFGGIGDLPMLVGTGDNPASTAARFAPDVVAAAETDPVAQALVATAVEALARTAETAASRLPPPAPTTLAVIGGLLKTGPHLRDRLFERLAAGRLHRQAAAGTALDGARLLAHPAGTVLEPLLVRRSFRDCRRG